MVRRIHRDLARVHQRNVDRRTKHAEGLASGIRQRPRAGECRLNDVRRLRRICRTGERQCAVNVDRTVVGRQPGDLHISLDVQSAVGNRQ